MSGQSSRRAAPLPRRRRPTTAEVRRLQDAARRLVVELERLVGGSALAPEALERAARVAAAEQSWRDGLGVLLDAADVAMLLGVDDDRVAALVDADELIVLRDGQGAAHFPAYQFHDGRAAPLLTRAHRTLIETGHVSPGRRRRGFARVTRSSSSAAPRSGRASTG